MKKYLPAIIVTLVILGFGVSWQLTKEVPQEKRVACTQEAKLCPDGSAVSRTGPNCEFAACPEVVDTTGGGDVDTDTGNTNGEDTDGEVTGGGGSGILPFDSGATGRVLVGPTCPVMREPPDPNCADKPYPTTVEVFAVGSYSSAPFATVNTDKEGVYKVVLPPGDYTLHPVGGKPFPSCSTTDITVTSSTMLDIDLSCDTGIR